MNLEFLFDDETSEIFDINRYVGFYVSKADIDMAGIHGADIEKLKKDRLKSEKHNRMSALNEEFGIKDEIKYEEIDGIPKSGDGQLKDRQEKLWDLLQGKGLTDGK